MRRVLVSGVAVAALLGSTVGTAQSATAVTFTDKPTFTFLTAKQAPKSTAYPKWTQTKVIKGKKSAEGCAENPFVNAKTELRSLYGSYTYGNNLQGEYSIRQYGLRASSETAAKKLVNRIAACFPAKDTAAQDAVPQYGSYKVKNGLKAGVVKYCDLGKNRYAMQWAYGRDRRDVMMLIFFTKNGSCTPSKTSWVDLSKKALQQF